jgi:hypothetical protein
MKNLREALEPILDRLHVARQAAADVLADAPHDDTPRGVPSVAEIGSLAPPDPTLRLPASGIPPPAYLEQREQQRRATRKERYDQVVALGEAGKGVRTIAPELRMNRQTVRR